MYSLFSLLSAILWLVGLVAAIGWLKRGGRTLEQALRSQLAAELRQKAAGRPDAINQALMEAAGQIEDPAAGPSVASFVSSLPQLAGQPGHVVTTQQTAAAPQAPETKDWWDMDLSLSTAKLDNVNLLLFLGAFLVVASAGIFIGVNYDSLSGIFKTGFLAILATLFLLSGLMMSRFSNRLRPAGETFTGIGLVLAPLVGLAAYNFTAARLYPGLIWFITSLAVLMMYLVVLQVTRHTYVVYFMGFSCLSLFESSIKLFDGPVYWYGWGMAVTSVVLLAFGRWRGWWPEAAHSLDLTGQLFMPISLLMALAYTGESGWTQFGLTVLLAAGFYGVQIWLENGHQRADAYFGLALTGLPVGLASIIWEQSGSGVVSALLLVGAGLYTAIAITLKPRLNLTRQLMLAVIANVLPFATLLVSLDDEVTVLAGLLVSVAVGGLTAAVWRQTGLATIAVMSSLAVPYVALRLVVEPLPPAGWLPASYLLLAPVYIYLRQLTRHWADNPEIPSTGGLLATLVLAILSAALVGTGTLLVTVGTSALIMAAYAWLERQPAYILVAAALSYLALYLVPEYAGWQSETANMFIMLAAVSWYVVGFSQGHTNMRTWSEAWRLAGIMGALVGIIIGFDDPELTFYGPTALALLSGFVMGEGYLRRSANIMEGGAAVAVLAFNWFCVRLECTNAQVYTWPWTLYLAGLAYNRRHLGQAVYDGWVAAALASATLPVAIQALADDGQMYGLELIIIALILISGGLAWRYRLVAWWGAGTLIAEVLYQMQDVLFAIPKYLISALIGLGLLAVAIYLLSRRPKNQL